MLSLVQLWRTLENIVILSLLQLIKENIIWFQNQITSQKELIGNLLVIETRKAKPLGE